MNWGKRSGGNFFFFFFFFLLLALVLIVRGSANYLRLSFLNFSVCSWIRIFMIKKGSLTIVILSMERCLYFAPKTHLSLSLSLSLSLRLSRKESKLGRKVGVRSVIKKIKNKKNLWKQLYLCLEPPFKRLFFCEAESEVLDKKAERESKSR
jgi:hypothetical protein